MCPIKVECGPCGGDDAAADPMAACAAEPTVAELAAKARGVKRQGLGGGLGRPRSVDALTGQVASEGDIPELASFMDEEATALALTNGDDPRMDAGAEAEDAKADEAEDAKADEAEDAKADEVMKEFPKKEKKQKKVKENKEAKEKTLCLTD